MIKKKQAKLPLKVKDEPEFSTPKPGRRQVPEEYKRAWREENKEEIAKREKKKKEEAKKSKKTVQVKKTVKKIKEETEAKEKIVKGKPIVSEFKDAAEKRAGKWVIEIKSKNEYVAVLFSSNGQIMLSSEIYTTEEGARAGIDTIIRGIENGVFIIYENKNGNYYYKLKNAGNRLLCVGEIYKSKSQCQSAIESVKRIAKASTVSKTAQKGEYVSYSPLKRPKYQVKKGLEGKWKIETLDGKYTAKLYASNGQVMLVTEGVSSALSAETAIESVRKNCSAGNFVVEKDKFGRFYYKLRNAQKSVICIGEAYETLDSCTSAIETVRKYAKLAILVK